MFTGYLRISQWKPALRKMVQKEHTELRVPECTAGELQVLRECKQNRWLVNKVVPV